MIYTDQDYQFMQHALQLAEQGLYHTSPNPRVGCVIVRDHQIIGQGYTQAAGLDHAEIQAIKNAKLHHHSLEGATVYLTLEPCSHYGRTPPCVEALIAERVGKVFISVLDPNPLVNGKGIKRLKEAGIIVDIGLGADQTRALNIGFISRMKRGIPWVRLKTAASLDGKTALSNGQSQWITSEAARKDGHHWRARACAILTGIGTILADDPSLNVRYVETSRQPLKVILDRQLNIPLHAKVLQHTPVLIICDSDQDIYDAKAMQLREKGAEVIALKASNPSSHLLSILHLLVQKEINELHVEAGHRLNGAFIDANLVDELLIYLAPQLLGANAMNMYSFKEPKTLTESPQFIFHSYQAIDRDLRIIARRPSSLLTH